MKKNKLLNRNEFDFVLVCITAICILFGCIIINSAVKSYGANSYVLIQLVAALVGGFVMLIIASSDYERVGSYIKLIYILSILALVAVLLLGTGRESTGSKSWIRFGPIGIQPSEFVKIGFIVSFSKLCSKYGRDINKPKNILKLVIYTGVLLGLIMLQPDFGTTMVFIVIFCGIIFTAGISYKYIIGTALAIIAAIPVAWNFVLQEYQKNRIRVFFNPESDPLGSGYHVMQSKITIGSGGFFGKGLGQGTQTQLEILPVKHTDFIYSVVGEELGIIGCLLVAGLLFALVFRCIHNAKNAKNAYGSYICIGVACMFLAHIFENIGMCIGLMPVTGIPLPFFSYGGSSVVTNLMAIGLVLSVRRKQNEIDFEPSDAPIE